VTPIPPKTLILGGGLAGLLAAWRLRAQGREIELWEASSAVGGWAQTLPWPGPEGEAGWLERGPQGLRFPRNGALATVLHELDLALRPVLPKGPHWLGRGGRRCPSPATPAGLLRAPGLDLGERLRLLLEPFQPAGQDPNEHLQAFMARRFGPAFAREWLPALVAGVFAAPPERIGLDALPRLRRLDKRGGLLLGGLRSGPERTRHPEGGTGALALALAARLGCVHLNRRAETLEPLAGGRWRVLGEGHSAEVEEVVLALPPVACAALLQPFSPEAALRLGAIPMLDLRVWHSRHAPVPGWERGFNLLLHPPEGKGLLGILGLPVEDPRAAGGLLQVRTFLGGAYAVEPALESWPGVAAELRHWLPELSEAVQVREEPCPGAFPLLGPGHGARVAALLAELPPGLHWLGAARFGPSIADLAEGIRAWAQARQA
jgi:oxygen-dependent protoporphyrinogen oxidase